MGCAEASRMMRSSGGTKSKSNATGGEKQPSDPTMASYVWASVQSASAMIHGLPVPRVSPLAFNHHTMASPGAPKSTQKLASFPKHTDGALTALISGFAVITIHRESGVKGQPLAWPVTVYHPESSAWLLLICTPS